MAKEYLDKAGLTYFWEKLKGYFQPKLVSGTNIKTINNNSLLGSGNITIQGGGGAGEFYVNADTGSGTQILGGEMYFNGDGYIETTATDVNGESEIGFACNMSSFLDFFYPIGSYYETSNTSFNPNTTWGGTWVEDSAGLVTVAQDTTQTEFDTVGETGGSKYIQNHAHSFTQPTITSKYTNNSPTNGSSARANGGGTSTATNWATASGGTVNGVQTTSHGTMSTGNSGNLQPYKVVKRWHRTA